MEVGIIIIAIVVTLSISWAIAEFFGTSKHIGFGWTFAITMTTAFIGGIIALLVSPSAKNKPTKGGNGHVIGAVVCFIFGALNIFMLNPLSIGFFVLGAYLLKLSEGEVVNSIPKFYFRKSDAQERNPTSYSERRYQKSDVNSERGIDEKISDLKNLYDKGILSKDELKIKLKDLEKLRLETSVKQSKEYQQLQRFHDEGFLTSNEFYEKVERMKESYGQKTNTNTGTRRSSITLKGFKKAVEIYSMAIFQNDEEMIDKLSFKLQQILGFNNTGNARDFIRKTLEEYNSHLNHNEKVKIISLIGSYSNTRQDMPNSKRFIVKFTDMSETELWHSSHDLYVLYINGEKQFFPFAKDCLNYITNNK